jgi:hypothetical protein
LCGPPPAFEHRSLGTACPDGCVDPLPDHTRRKADRAQRDLSIMLSATAGRRGPEKTVDVITGRRRRPLGRALSPAFDTDCSGRRDRARLRASHPIIRADGTGAILISRRTSIRSARAARQGLFEKTVECDSARDAGDGHLKRSIGPTSLRNSFANTLASANRSRLEIPPRS